MRHQFGTIDAIERLVQSGELQSGFKRLKQLGLIDWTIEFAVISFCGRVLQQCQAMCGMAPPAGSPRRQGRLTQLTSLHGDSARGPARASQGMTRTAT